MLAIIHVCQTVPHATWNAAQWPVKSWNCRGKCNEQCYTAHIYIKPDPKQSHNALSPYSYGRSGHLPQANDVSRPTTVISGQQYLYCLLVYWLITRKTSYPATPIIVASAALYNRTNVNCDMFVNSVCGTPYLPGDPIVRLDNVDLPSGK